MMQPAPSPSTSLWQQLAQRLDTGRARPLARRGIEAYSLVTARGIPYLILRSPDGRAFLRLAPWQYAVLQAMDGSRTMRDLLIIHLEQRGVLDPVAVATLVALLHTHGFIEGDGGDCYADLALRLRSGRLRRAIAAMGRSWELPAVARALVVLCALCAHAVRNRAVVILVLLLSVAGVLAPALAVVARHASLGDAPGTLTALGLAIWAATALYAIGRGIGSSLVGRPPRRAGIQLLAGIPVLWLDARECLASGQRGSRAVWLAGPLTLLCAAAVASLPVMVAPTHSPALAVALTWALPAVWLLAPPSMPPDDVPASDQPVAEARGYRWWMQPSSWRPAVGSSSPRAYALSGLGSILWICALLALSVAFLRAGLLDLLTVSWGERRVFGMLIAVLAAYVAACGVLQFALPAARRWGMSAASRRLRRRRPPAAIRRRSSILARCEELEALTSEQRLALASRVEEVRYPSGFDVVVQGEAGDDFYIVMEGTAEAIDESGPTVLQQYGPGDSFGKYALIYHALRAATVRATTDLRLLRVNRATFDAYLAPRLVLQERLAALADERRILHGVPLLRHLDSQAMDLLLPRLISERYGPGEAIIRQGERGEHFYIVKSGTVEVVDESQMPPRRLSVLGNGEYFGEIALLLDQPRVATVRALVEVTVWRLSRTDFELVLGRYLGLDASLSGTGLARLAATRASGA